MFNPTTTSQTFRPGEEDIPSENNKVRQDDRLREGDINRVTILEKDVYAISSSNQPSNILDRHTATSTGEEPLRSSIPHDYGTTSGTGTGGIQTTPLTTEAGRHVPTDYVQGGGTSNIGATTTSGLGTGLGSYGGVGGIGGTDYTSSQYQTSGLGTHGGVGGIGGTDYTSSQYQSSGVGTGLGTGLGTHGGVGGIGGTDYTSSQYQTSGLGTGLGSHGGVGGIGGTTSTIGSGLGSHGIGQSGVEVLDAAEKRIVESHLPDHLVGGTTGISTNIGQPTTSTIPITQSIERRVIDQPGVTIPIHESSHEQVVEPHLKDSMSMPHHAESSVHQSRWESQQVEMEKMRHENHHTFESWDRAHTMFIGERLGVADDLVSGMDKRLLWIEEGVAKVLKFFRDRASQEEEFCKAAKHGLPQLGQHFEKVDTPGFGSDFAKGMKENDAFHATQVKNSELLAHFIRKEILDWTLLPSEKNYMKQTESLRHPLHAVKKKLDHITSKRLRYYDKYLKAYDSLQKSTKVSPKENSLFRRQLKYVLASREETRLLNLYNEQALIAHDEYSRLSAARLTEIQKSMTMYLQKYTEIYQNTAATPEPILWLLERADSTEPVPNLFAIKNLLSPGSVDLLSKRYNRVDITHDDLRDYLLNFPESEDPTRSSFVIKEWEALKLGNLIKKPRLCSVIATADRNLLIIEKKHEEKELGKVKDPLQLRYTTVQNIEGAADGTEIKVIERTPGTLFHHTSKTKLKFDTAEEAQQFAQFVNSQTSGDV